MKLQQKKTPEGLEIKVETKPFVFEIDEDKIIFHLIGLQKQLNNDYWNADEKEKSLLGNQIIGYNSGLQAAIDYLKKELEY